MSDRLVRPTLPPKANSVNFGVNQPSSEAIRGAAQLAFRGRASTATTAPSTARPYSSSARSAAAAAGSGRSPTASNPSPISGQNATNTTTASFAAQARGRPPPGVEGQPSNAGTLIGPTLNPMRQSRARQTNSAGGSPSQIAARMASSSRSPARLTLARDNPKDIPALPQDHSAVLAGKAASSKSYQDATGSPSSHSQTSTPPLEQPSLNFKKIPHLPKKLPVQPPRDPSAARLAGAAAAQAASKHAKPQVVPTSPGVGSSKEYFPSLASESLSPDRSTLESSLDATSTMSAFASPVESEKNAVFDDNNGNSHDLQRLAPIPIKSGPRISPGAASGANGPHITDHRTGLTDRTLADAIVASSLASSRAPSPTKVDPSLRSTRRSRSHSHPTLPLLPHHFLHHEKIPDLPTKTSQAAPRNLKQTLRKHPAHKEDDEEETTKRGRKHFMRKHPHKHHEGDRKRWRDKVTERERRRYEGVWAANRGLFAFWDEDTAFGESWKRAPEADLVVNVVVRDIWERSRLPKDVLEEIWDLVATSEDAQALQRDQFVVGLWLVDQRLKGRKLPVRVSSDVWNSVRHVGGVKVSRKPY